MSERQPYNPTVTARISDTRYFGKICAVHPGFHGERHIKTALCCECTRTKRQMKRAAMAAAPKVKEYPLSDSKRIETLTMEFTRERAKALAVEAGKEWTEWGEHWTEAVEWVAQDTARKAQDRLKSE